MALRNVFLVTLTYIFSFCWTCRADLIACPNKYPPIPQYVLIKVSRLIPLNENPRDSAYRSATARAFSGKIMRWRSRVELPKREFQFVCKHGQCEGFREGQELAAMVTNRYCECCSLSDFLSLPPEEQFFHINKVISEDEYRRAPDPSPKQGVDWWYSEGSKLPR